MFNVFVCGMDYGWYADIAELQEAIQGFNAMERISVYHGTSVTPVFIGYAGVLNGRINTAKMLDKDWVELCK